MCTKENEVENRMKKIEIVTLGKEEGERNNRKVEKERKHK